MYISKGETLFVGAMGIVGGVGNLAIATAELFGDRNDVPKEFWNDQEVLNGHLFLHGGLGGFVALFSAIILWSAFRKTN